jgi:hypothetical protein
VKLATIPGNCVTHPGPGSPTFALSSINKKMKKGKLLISAALVLLFLSGLSSCIAPPQGYRGHDTPKGWNKNSNNPHHPNSTNPGHGHDKNK